MSKRLATDIAAFLKVNERYRSWERLPDEFLRRSRRLSAEKVVEVAPISGSGASTASGGLR